MWRLLLVFGVVAYASAGNVYKMRMPESAAQPKVNDAPNFGSFYSVSGEIELPYTELRETFTAYFDVDAKRSRIDYYDGLVMTYQRGDAGQFGTGYKIAYMTSDTVLNEQNCFLINGTQAAPVAPQNVFPDSSNMQQGEQELVRGTLCETWRNVTIDGGRVNTYTLYVAVGTRAPVRYEMMGYDTLLGSHYDKYIVDYWGFNNVVRPDASVYDVPTSLTCHGFPGPGSEGSAMHRVLMNPISEYVHRDRTHVDEAFASFKKTHDRSYADVHEHAMRRDTFARNVRFIDAHNRRARGNSHRLAVNRFADRSEDELKVLRGFRSSRRSSNVNEPLKYHGATQKSNDVPDEFNWVIRGAVTPVRDQAICGSCWSFGTTGAIEGANFVKTGNLVSLSQQQLIDCSWGFGNNGCDGGEDFRAYDWMLKNGGLAADSDYGAYLGQDGRCNLNISRAVQISGYVNVTPYDAEALRAAIATIAPISIGIDAGHHSFVFYSHGVYYEPDCGNKPEDLDHAVLAVGYGVLNNEPYWLVKNSWSTYWGTQGYVLMSQRDNNCGVLTSPTYPLIA